MRISTIVLAALSFATALAAGHGSHQNKSPSVEHGSASATRMRKVHRMKHARHARGIAPTSNGSSDIDAVMDSVNMDGGSLPKVVRGVINDGCNFADVQCCDDVLRKRAEDDSPLNSVINPANQWLGHQCKSAQSLGLSSPSQCSNVPACCPNIAAVPGTTQLPACYPLFDA